ncbi:hypothetical protein PR048_020725 [Dryococelus australis]|uniref:Peptidase A2 domain-containing protein n=1 Tax=Dryococelus australis TaxID=614101 RepID=A0ABQ9H750_9NEOP|nr:hypothetical protein PR048_020725 [Dryococelus australis]
MSRDAAPGVSDVKQLNLEAKIDTGADVCVLLESLYKETFSNLKLIASDKMLIAPIGLNLNILGIVQGTVKYKDCSCVQ